MSAVGRRRSRFPPRTPGWTGDIHGSASLKGGSCSCASIVRPDVIEIGPLRNADLK
jgi:hypothetical protein